VGYKLGDQVTVDFTTHNPFTGNIQDGDVLPTCAVYEDTVDIPMLTPLVVRRVGAGGLGDYRVNFSVSEANGFEVGKTYNVVVAATVAGVTAKARILAFTVEAVPVHYRV